MYLIRMSMGSNPVIKKTEARAMILAAKQLRRKPRLIKHFEAE